MDRACGGCTACCKTHGVLTYLKLPGVWCEHCMIGGGCRIYEGRPAECREFKCAWLTGVGGQHHRPDIIGVVPEVREIPQIGKALWLWELRTGVLDTVFAQRWTRRNLDLGVCVMHVAVGGKSKLYLAKKFEATSLPSFVFELSPEAVEVVRFSESRLKLS